MSSVKFVFILPRPLWNIRSEMWPAMVNRWPTTIALYESLLTLSNDLFRASKKRGVCDLFPVFKYTSGQYYRIARFVIQLQIIIRRFYFLFERCDYAFVHNTIIMRNTYCVCVRIVVYHEYKIYINNAPAP